MLIGVHHDLEITDGYCSDRELLVRAQPNGRLLDSQNRVTQVGMKHAYLGWIDREGLKRFQSETESVDRFLIRLRQQHDRHTMGIWSVLDTEVLDGVQTLLDAAEYQAALHCLLCHATFVGQHR